MSHAIFTATKNISRFLFLKTTQLLSRTQSDTYYVYCTCSEFLSPAAHSPINIDSKVHESIKDNMQEPGRYTFDPAMEHIFQLMKSDSYPRYLRSDQYRELLNPKKKV